MATVGADAQIILTRADGTTATSDANGALEVNVAKDETIHIQLLAVGEGYPESLVIWKGEQHLAVVKNTATGIIYSSVAEALAKAKSGETVQLTAGAVESVVQLNPGVTLDLNGNNLSAAYVVSFDGDMIDSTGIGKLICTNVALEGNSRLPIWSENGYVFDQYNMVARLYQYEDRLEFRMDPRLRYNRNLLADGAEDNNITVVARLTWETEQGIAYQNFVYNEDMVKDVFSSPLKNGGNSVLFTLETSGYENWTNLTYTAVLISDAKTEVVSATWKAEDALPPVDA